MIKIQGIDHVAISVRSLDTSLKFYTEVLGLRVTEREYSKPGIEYFLDCGASLIGLIQGNESEGKHFLQDGGLGGNHISFRVHTDDFDKIVEEIKNRGITITYMKKREKSWSLYFLDPDGNKLEVTAWSLEDKNG